MGRKGNFRKTQKTVAILGEGKTEYVYFTGLKRFENLCITIKPDKPKHSSSILNIEKKIKSLVEVFDDIFIVIDLDRIITNQKELQKYKRMKAKYESKPEIQFIESMPCFEFWYLLHNKLTSKLFYKCNESIKELEKCEIFKNYSKTKNYYSIIKALQKTAIINAKNVEKSHNSNSNKLHPKTDVYQIIEKLLVKTNN